MTSKENNFIGCCTVFVYRDGFLVQPSQEVAVNPSDCRVIEDSMATDAGQTSAAKKLRGAALTLAQPWPEEKG